MSKHEKHTQPIGDIALRTGVSVTALRFYERKGLIKSERSSGGHRLFSRSDIRRVSFILIAQNLGFSLQEIGIQLAKLPESRTPSKRDWERLSRGFKQDIETRITGLERMRDTLSSCIGCGCLSLKVCALYNPKDEAQEQGSGPRFLVGDRPKNTLRIND